MSYPKHDICHCPALPAYDMINRVTEPQISGRVNRLRESANRDTITNQKENEMAAGRLAIPGSEYGPCEGECKHIDCAATRKMAETLCVYCQKPIGYDTGFYNLDNPDGLAHSVCYEEAIEAH